MARISKLRGSESFRRRPGQKRPRSIILIICEGKTEQDYFEAARIKYELTTAEIMLAENTKGSAPISVVECAEHKCKEEGGYDSVYCVFDRNGHESFDRAREKIKNLSNRSNKPLPIEEAISIPCFELWVLLHFERTDAPFNQCSAVFQRICEHHIPGYEKANPVISRGLMEKMEDAIGNAEWLEEQAKNNNYNPYTSVHRVIQHFQSVASSPDGME